MQAKPYFLLTFLQRTAYLLIVSCKVIILKLLEEVITFILM